MTAVNHVIAKNMTLNSILSNISSLKHLCKNVWCWCV